MPRKVDEAKRLQQLIANSAAELVKRASDKDAELKTLRMQVKQLQRDMKRLESEAQAAKRQRIDSQPTRGDVFQTGVLVKRVMEFVGPDEYLFAASINRICRQVQIELSRKRAERSDSKPAKLRTSFTAALASPARLRWAFSSGLKQKDKYKKPLQLVQSAVKVSSDPAAVLGLLRVQSLEKVDPKAGSELFVEAAERGDLKLLKWLHKHECPWDANTCDWAAIKGRLDILQWVREHGCPWREDTCWCAARGGHLQLLKWLRAHGCAWDADTCSEAALLGRLDILKWAHAQGCPWDEHTYWCAAQGGHLHILQWARKHSCPWDIYTCSEAAGSGHLDILIWAHEQGCRWSERTCYYAAMEGHLHVLQWAREHGGCPWDEHTCECAARDGHLHVLQWARANGCPWDLDDVLPAAAASGNVTMLEWLQQSSERPWTAAEMSEMLDEAGSHDKMQTAKWLRERGAEWPSSFYSYDNSMECMISWSVETVKWALSEGCTWGDWQCEKLAPELYDEDAFREDAVELLAWAHENGCPCTCGNSSGGSNTQ
jgi:hypothetical protein